MASADLLHQEVNVKRNEVWDSVNTRQYRSTSGEVLKVYDQKISEVWPELSSDELHVVVTLTPGISSVFQVLPVPV
jgi:glutathionyl-hydroquinone reductase